MNDSAIVYKPGCHYPVDSSPVSRVNDIGFQIPKHSGKFDQEKRRVSRTLVELKYLSVTRQQARRFAAGRKAQHHMLEDIGGMPDYGRNPFLHAACFKRMQYMYNAYFAHTDRVCGARRFLRSLHA
jgi:hypothetical protein